MKKLLCFFTLALFTFSSCETLEKTATTANISSDTKSATLADLKVGERVTATMDVSKEIRRGGLNNIKQAVEAQALKEGGNADLLLEPQFIVEKHRGLIGSKVTKITVSGRPAFYTNFRSVPDSVWCNPVFRGAKVVYRNGSNSKDNNISKLNNFKDAYAANMVARSGWNAYVVLSGGYNKDEYEYNGHDEGSNDGFDAMALLSVGYNFTGNWFVGAGSGVQYMDQGDRLGVPFFGQVRYSLFKHKESTPFIDYKLGALLHTRNIDFQDKCGFFGCTTLGYSIGKFDVGVSFVVSKIDLDMVECNTGSVNLSLGYKF